MLLENKSSNHFKQQEQLWYFEVRHTALLYQLLLIHLNFLSKNYSNKKTE